jgi:hypothetical protein
MGRENKSALRKLWIPCGTLGLAGSETRRHTNLGGVSAPVANFAEAFAYGVLE